MELWLSLIAAIFGLAIGSFMNAAEYRLANGISLIKPQRKNQRSMCPHCKHELAAKDLIPVLSYLSLRGKCRYCHKRISPQYPIVEITTAAVFAATAFTFGYSATTLVYCLYSAILIFIFLYDHKYQLILDKVSIPAIFAAGILSWQVLGLTPETMFVGALIGGGFFLTQFILSKGLWVGGGDIRLGVLMGLMLGWPQTLLALFLAYIAGGAVGAYLLSTKKAEGNTQIAFGTFLSAATILCFFAGEDMIQWYIGLL